MSGKHVPQRTCVGCRQVLSKKSLVRIVRTPEGVKLDQTSKALGRGAYLHRQRSCWERGLRGSIAKALKVDLTSDDRHELTKYMDQLPAEIDG